MKACRHSGMPVKLEHLAAYKIAWLDGYDKAKAECGNDMLSLQGDLKALEEQLQVQYSLVEEWPELLSAADFRAKIEEYQCPIMVAKSSEAPFDLVYVIMDKDLL